MTHADGGKMVWKAVIGYEGLYEVSSNGEVRGLRDSNGHKRTKPRTLKQYTRKAPYVGVTLSKNNMRRCAHVHRIVLEAFKGPRPSGYEGSHLDGNGRNNHADNLAWETVVRNHQRMREHGTQNCGRDHWSARLNEEQVRFIRKHYQRGNGLALARRFDISVSNVCSIAKGRTWKHVR